MNQAPNQPSLDPALTSFWQELLTNLSLSERLAPIYLFVPHSGVATSLREQIAGKWQAHPDWPPRSITDITFDPHVPNGMRAIVRPYLATNQAPNTQHPALWLDLSPRETASANEQEWEQGRERALLQLNLMRTELERDCLAPLVIVLPQQTLEIPSRGANGRVQPWIRQASWLCPDIWHIRRLGLEVPLDLIPAGTATALPGKLILILGPRPRHDEAALVRWHSIFNAGRLPTAQETEEAYSVLEWHAHYAQAIEMLSAWLKRLEANPQTASEWAHEVAAAHQMLGNSYLQLAQYEAATTHIRQALTQNEAIYGHNHPEVVACLNNLADLLYVTNRFAEAEPLYRHALLIDEASYGTNHPTVARDLNNLAVLLQATNRLAETEPLYRRALTIDEASYGKDHPDVAIDLNNLAELLKATNRLAEAEPFYRRALAIDEASYGTNHPTVARDLNNLAVLLYATNRLTEAEPLFRRQLEFFVQFKVSNGHEHPHLKAAINNYASLLATMALPKDEIKRRIDNVLHPPMPDAHP